MYTLRGAEAAGPLARPRTGAVLYNSAAVRTEEGRLEPRGEEEEYEGEGSGDDDEEDTESAGEFADLPLPEAAACDCGVGEKAAVSVSTEGVDKDSSTGTRGELMEAESELCEKVRGREALFKERLLGLSASMAEEVSPGVSLGGVTSAILCSIAFNLSATLETYAAVAVLGVGSLLPLGLSFFDPTLALGLALGADAGEGAKEARVLSFALLATGTASLLWLLLSACWEVRALLVGLRLSAPGLLPP